MESISLSPAKALSAVEIVQPARPGSGVSRAKPRRQVILTAAAVALAEPAPFFAVTLQLSEWRVSVDLTM